MLNLLECRIRLRSHWDMQPQSANHPSAIEGDKPGAVSWWSPLPAFPRSYLGTSGEICVWAAQMWLGAPRLCPHSPGVVSFGSHAVSAQFSHNAVGLWGALCFLQGLMGLCLITATRIWLGVISKKISIWHYWLLQLCNCKNYNLSHLWLVSLWQQTWVQRWVVKQPCTAGQN